MRKLCFLTLKWEDCHFRYWEDLPILEAKGVGKVLTWNSLGIPPDVTHVVNLDWIPGSPAHC